MGAVTHIAADEEPGEGTGETSIVTRQCAPGTDHACCLGDYWSLQYGVPVLTRSCLGPARHNTNGTLVNRDLGWSVCCTFRVLQFTGFSHSLAQCIELKTRDAEVYVMVWL